MKKSILKAIPAAILASVCLTTAALAYIDMGQYISYSVKSNAQTWDNQNNSWAWYLHTPTDCRFSGTTSAGCSANFDLYEWTIGNSRELIKSAGVKSNGFSIDVEQKYLIEDDYFAEVKYVSGGVNNGYLTFKKG